MNINYNGQSELSFNAGSTNADLDQKLQLIRVVDAIAELSDLLENYAPAWYTERHRSKVESAMGLVKNLRRT